MNENLVPWLRSGVGVSPQDGGCVMQVVDWIDRGEWTDSPPCVHPVIQRLAISANDSLDDAGRQKLLDLAPRMMGTASTDKRLAVQLAVFCAESVLPIYEARYSDGKARERIEAARNWLVTGVRPAADPAYAAYPAYAAANAAYAAAYAAYAAYAAAYAAANAAANAAYAAAYAAYAADNAAYAAANAAYAADNAAYAKKSGGNARLDLLTAVLDEYDRLVPDRDKPQLDYGPVCAVMAGAA